MNSKSLQYIPEDYILERAEYFRHELKEANREYNKWIPKKSRDETGNPRSFTKAKLQRIKNDCRARIMFIMDAIRALELMEKNDEK